MDENPSFEAPNGTQIPNNTENPLPNYVTAEQMQEMFDGLADSLSRVQPQERQVTQQPTNDDSFFETLGDRLLTDPAGAAKAMYEKAKQDAKNEVLAEVNPHLTRLVSKEGVNSLSNGLDSEEKQYIAGLVDKGLVHPAALENPELRDVLVRAAKNYGGEKRGVPAVSPEGGVGGGKGNTTIKNNARAATFDAYFGEGAYKKAVAKIKQEQAEEDEF